MPPNLVVVGWEECLDVSELVSVAVLEEPEVLPVAEVVEPEVFDSCWWSAWWWLEAWVVGQTFR